MKIRGVKSSDIRQMVSLWKETGVYFEPLDKEGRLEKKINKGTEIFIVAEDNKKIIGTAIGSYGWRASIDHLIVNAEYMDQDIGEQLFGEMKKRLKKKGVTIALINSRLPREKWEKMGCRYIGTADTYTIEF